MADIKHARQFITETSGAEAANLVLSRLRASADRLKRFPESGPPGRVEGTRELVVLRTPFIAAYSVAGSEVQVLAVIHHGRKWPRAM